MSDYLNIHPQPCDCPFCGAERKLKAQSELAARSGSARPLVVTQDLVNEIIQRARASRWGLDAAKCETTTEHYADEDAHTLAMILVNGWEAKYDLVSLFAAAVEVVNEKAQNAELTHSGKKNL